MPLKTVIERTSELRMQFPVSSGQQHRKGEEWKPVSPPAKKTEEKVVPIPPPSNIPLPNASVPIKMPPVANAPLALPAAVSHQNVEVPAKILTASGIVPSQQLLPSAASDVSTGID